MNHVPRCAAIRSLAVTMLAAALAACQPTPAPTPTATEPSAPPTEVSETTATEEPSLAPPAATAEPSLTAAATETEAPDESATAPPFTLDLPARLPTITGELPQNVWAFPGPLHYEGDVLDIVIDLDDGIVLPEGLSVMVQIDDQPATEATASMESVIANMLYRLEDVFNTTGEAGTHTIHVTSSEQSSVNHTYTFEVLPADQRPEAEASAQWTSREIACCVLHYLTNTAAARDIDMIARVAQEAIEEVQEASGATLPRKFQITLLDRIWLNGAFGGSGKVTLSYTDRNYGPMLGESGLETLLRHEAIHVLGGTINDQGIFGGEGTAVFFAGGHFKPEPFRERGAALYDLGWLRRQNHEISYLKEALPLAYIAEVHGKEAFDMFLRYRMEGVDPDEFVDRDDWFDSAVEAVIGMSPTEFDVALVEWLDSADPGDQLADLYLTVALQELRRHYQHTQAMYPTSVLWSEEPIYTRSDLIPDSMREPSAPENIALEVLIMHAQQAIVEGRYDEANAMVEMLRAALIDGDRDAGPLDDYRAIAEAASEAGYEVVDIDLDGDSAIVQAIRTQPQIESLTFTRDGDEWVIEE